jgi:hypothetical protein
MTQMQDPNEIWRASLSEAPRVVEEHPPVFLRAEAWPYPELDRVWVRLETSPFDAFPNLELLLTDPEGELVSDMFMVEMRETYQSLTLHLRQPPRPGELYRLTLELSRDEQVLDTRELDMELVFRDPKESKSESE